MILFQQCSRLLAPRRAADTCDKQPRNLRHRLLAGGLGLLLWAILPAAQAQQGLTDFRTACGSCHGGVSAVPNGPNFNAANSQAIITQANAHGMGAANAGLWASIVSYIDSVKPVVNISVPYVATNATPTATSATVDDIYLGSFYAGITGIATTSAPGRGSVNYTGTVGNPTANYTPTAGQCGADSWQYRGTVSGTAPDITNTTTRTANVTIANPVLGANNFSTSIAYSTSPTVIPLSLTGDGPTSVTIIAQPSVGSAAGSGTSSITYTASASAYTSPVTIQYRTNACGQVSPTRTITLTVTPPPAPVFTTPATNPGNASNGFTGVAYSYSVAASSTTTAATFSLSAGSLPPGLSLASNGAITGTPTTVGSFSATIAATNLNPTPTTTVVNFNISLGPPVFTSGGTANGAVGATYTAGSPLYTATATNGPNTFAAPGGLPAGLTINASTGAITGTPTTAATASYNLTAQNSNTTAILSVSFAISNVAPVITSPGPAAGQTGVPFSFQITATNAPNPTGYSATGLPPGLTVSSSGLISGTPTTVGSYSPTISASNSTGTGSLVISMPITLGPPVITSATTASGAVGIVFGGYQITATNNPTSFTSSGLPPGLTMNAAGLISGTPTSNGTFSATIGALNGTLPNGSQTVSFNIAVGIPAITSATTASFLTGQPFSYQITGTNGPTGFTATGLPSGLTVSASGLISGTTYQIGNFTIPLTATNGTGTGNGSLALTTTLGPPVVTSATTANIVVTQAFNYQITAQNAPTSFNASGLPGGLTVNASSGLISGVPTSTGTFTASVSASNAIGTGSQTVTFTSVNPPAPTVAAKSATIGFNTATQIDLATSISGQFNSITVSSAPAHGSTSISGTIVTFTPTTGYFGADSFNFTATGLGGTSAPATVSLTVSTQAPTAGSTTLSTPVNTPATLDLAPFIQGSAISGVVIGTAPGHGTATVNGTKVTYTPANNYFGPDTFTYSAFGNVGTSAPATVTVTVIGRPDPTKDAAVLGLIAAQADAAQRFSRAQISNVQSRMESLHRRDERDGGTTAKASFGGKRVAAIPTAPSGGGNAPDTQAAPRSAAASGMTPMAVNSYFANSYAMAGGINSDAPAFRPVAAPFASSAISLLTTGTLNVAALGSGSGGYVETRATDAFNFWLGGVANFGTRSATGTRNGLDFTTSGVSLGVDHRVAQDWVLGLAAGFARDRSDIGNDGTYSHAQGYSAMAYASYQPSASTFVDSLIGVGSLDFKTQRYVLPINDYARSSRGGLQWFSSVSAGYEYRDNGVLISPYARIDYSANRLNQVSETGAGLYALTYDRQTTPSLQGALGLRAETINATSFGWAVPRVRTEFRHDFEGARDTTLAYADLGANGPRYNVSVAPTTRNSLVLGIGSDFVRRGGLTVSFDYQYQHSFSRDSNQAVKVLFSQDLDGRGSPFWESNFFLEPSKPKDFQVDAGFTFDSNVTRAKDTIDKLFDRSYSVNVGKGLVFPFMEKARAILTGTLGAENFQVYDRLNRASAGLQGELQYRNSAEFDSPTLALTVQGNADDYRSKLRSGSRYSVAASIRQPLTDRISLFAAASHNERYAKSTVFNNRFNALRLNIDYAYNNSDTFYLTGEYRRGQIISSGQASLANLGVADVFVLDDAFPAQFFTYRFNGRTVLSTLGYNIGYGPRHSLDISWRRAQSTPDAQPSFVNSRMTYIADQFSIIYLIRF